MKRFRLSTLMLLIVIAALGIALVRSTRREAELQARLTQSWPLFLKQKSEEARIRLYIEAIQQRRHQELAKRSKAETQLEERRDADINRQIEDMQRRHSEEQAKRELAKQREADTQAQLQPK
jgi:competence protein ComGF